MRRDVDRLARETFDLVVIGGGITGACIAHDASLRGLTVALVERQDFGGATSSASSKLLHGGMRYLQQARLDKLRESALERASFQAIGPHLTRFVPFAVPAYRGWLRGRAALAAGLAVYEALCSGQNRFIRDRTKRVPSSHRLERAELVRAVPALDQAAVTGAYVLPESQMHSTERMTLAFVKTAALHGAAVANYVAAEHIARDGHRVIGVSARDVLTGRSFVISGRLVANAAGPWLTHFNADTGIGSLTRAVTGFSKGAHIVTRELISTYAVALPTPRKTQAVIDRGGRHVFVIPWRGRSLIGTTNSPFDGTPDDVAATDRDVDDLIADVRAALPAISLDAGDVQYAFAGLYPLVERTIRADTYQGTGEYQIVDHAVAHNVQGYVSVLGAKYTTARRVAERAVDLLVGKLGRAPVPCATRTSPLVGGDIPDLSALREDMRRRSPDLDPAVLDYLIAGHGTDTSEVLRVAAQEPGGLRRLADNRESIEAEVIYAVEHEMAMRLDDVILRRTGLGTVGHPGVGCLRRCAELMKARLGWPADRVDEEIGRTERLFSVRPDFDGR